MYFPYQAEKLAVARRSLMLPHSGGEEQSIFWAFHECSLAFDDLKESDLSDDARMYVRRIRELMDTSGLVDERNEGLFLVKARALSQDERRALSNWIDSLANYFVSTVYTQG